MGLFDNLKNIVANAASDAIGDALNQVKDEVTETITEEIKEKTENAIVNGVKSYLNNAKEKVTNEEGKEAIDVLQNLVDDTANMKKTAMNNAVDDNNDDIDYEAKTKEDLIKLGKLIDNYDNTQNQ